MKAILTYHSIDDSGSVISIDAVTFRSHVQWLAESGVAVVSLQELVRLPDDADAIALTFDDGFENFRAAAWPLLRAHAFPVTLFVVTDHVGGTNNWSRGPAADVPHLPLLDWPSLVQLADEGVTLGSHTRTHPDLSVCTVERVSEELASAACKLREETGGDAECFAYPYGGYNLAVAHAAARVHALACTTDLRGVTSADDPFLLPRLDAYYLRQPGRLERFGSSAFRNYMWLRARGRQLRRVLTAGVNGR